MARLNNVDFAREFSVTKWFALSGNYAGVHSAIVNIRSRHDRRRVVKVYMHYDYKLNAYVTERA